MCENWMGKGSWGLREPSNRYSYNIAHLCNTCEYYNLKIDPTVLISYFIVWYMYLMLSLLITVFLKYNIIYLKKYVLLGEACHFSTILIWKDVCWLSSLNLKSSHTGRKQH